MAIFKRVSRENQVCNHIFYIFLLHHSIAGKRLKLQSKNETNLNLWKGFFVLLDRNDRSVFLVSI